MVEVKFPGDVLSRNQYDEYIQTREGQKMPFFMDKYGKKHRARWNLLKRDDKGSVFVIPE
jgi:hypothetical protein